MSLSAARTWLTPREADLGLRRITNRAGLVISVLQSGSLFAIEHRSDSASILINQVLGSPLAGGIARLLVRVVSTPTTPVEAVGPRADVAVGVGRDLIAWEGAKGSIRHRVTLHLLAHAPAWLWRVEVTSTSQAAVPIDAILVQDLGLGVRSFVANNEAYASQYIDHHVARHVRHGPVVMSRQNLQQDGKHPWVVQGCLDGAAAFATDALQLFGPGHRGADDIVVPIGTALPARRLQHEAACVAIQSLPVTLEPGATVAWRFFALYDADHAAASSDDDLARIDRVAWNRNDDARVTMDIPQHSVLQDARVAPSVPLTCDELLQRYPDRLLDEFDGDRPLSFFCPDPLRNRHVVLAAKELVMTRRHGTVLRSGQAMLPADSTLSATCWMHGVFAAQLTIGNTSFHKLFSVSRDPYNITRASGLRVLIDAGDGWQVLAVPSAFEMGLSDCRWIYALAGRVVTVSAIAAGDDPAMQWRIAVEGTPCRLLIYGHLVVGERELEHQGRVLADSVRHRLSFQPDPESLWGRRYPHAVYHLVTSTPEAIEAIGDDALLYSPSGPSSGSHVVIRTAATREFCFAVVGSLTDPAEAERLACKYEQPVDDLELLQPAHEFWTSVTRGRHIVGEAADVAALDASLPWLAHDAIIHLSVPRGLEQYTAAAWGTRDVCQGPVEFLLALEHDEPVKAILRIVFEQQLLERGDWPQWFMLEPYTSIQDRHSHGDVIVWPLKALSDYVEATGDFAFLDEPIAWCDDRTLQRTKRRDPVAIHVDKLIATVRERFIPGTHLIRYGEGDWNDSLQPADPRLRDVMVSSWTVALLYQQLARYAEILRRAGRHDVARSAADLASAMRADFNRLLIRDGTVAGYAVFESGLDAPELLLHPSDTRTGLKYSLLPMTRSILASLFTPEQARHHLAILRAHLLFTDGARLVDRPIEYHGGIERTFRRAESAAYFGREIGLMYTHAHLRYAEAMAVLGEADALWEALCVANPVGVTERVPNAALRQRNAYFSSSDAAFADRYQASDEWTRVRAGTVPVDGGWRVYSSGPGLYVNVLMRHALGVRRHFGKRVVAPVVSNARLWSPDQSAPTTQ